MGRRHRRRSSAANLASPQAPLGEYRDPDGNLLVLRGRLAPGARREYTRALSAGLDIEDAHQRATELLFERLAVSWTIAGLDLTAQKELVGRYRLASGPERQFVRSALRKHVEEHFPELEVP